MRANVENKRATLDRLRRSFLGCKVLVVDEVSMVGCGMMREIDSRLREITQCYEAPFGGLCILLMVNFVQLEPVAQPWHSFLCMGVSSVNKEDKTLWIRRGVSFLGCFANCALPSSTAQPTRNMLGLSRPFASGHPRAWMFERSFFRD